MRTIGRYPSKLNVCAVCALLVLLPWQASAGQPAASAPVSSPPLAADLQPYYAATPQSFATAHFTIVFDGDSSRATSLGAYLEKVYARFYSLMGDAGFTLNAPAAPL